MQTSAIETKWAPLAVLGLNAIAAWHPYPHAWQWALTAALVLSVLILLRAYLARGQLASRPLSIAVTAFVASRIILPLLVLAAGFAGVISDSDALIEAALLSSIALAIVTLV